MKRKAHKRSTVKHSMLRAADTMQAAATKYARKGEKTLSKQARGVAKFFRDQYAKGHRGPAIELHDSSSPNYRK